MTSHSTRPTKQADHRPNPTGRDAKGRFTAGNRGGPGNPFARRVAELRSAFIEAATPEDLKRICQRLITMAALGDLAAAKLVLSYLLGKVPEPVNPDTLDQEEYRQAAENPSMTELCEVARTRPAADLSVPFLRVQDVVNGLHHDQKMQDLIDGKNPARELDAEVDAEELDELEEDERMAAFENKLAVIERIDRELAALNGPSTKGRGGRASAAAGSRLAGPPSPKRANGRR